MGRPDRPLNFEAGGLAEFAAALRQVRQDAGRPTYRELAQRAHYSSTTLSDAAGGARLPTLEVTLAYVAACNGDVDAWRERWQALAGSPEDGRISARTGDVEPAAGRPATGDPGTTGARATPAGSPGIWRSAFRWRTAAARHWRYPVAAGLVCLVVASALIVHGVWPSDATGARRPTPAPTRSGTDPVLTPPAGPPEVTNAVFAATGGTACHTPRVTMDPYQAGAGDGWHRATAPGWTGDGCTNSFVYTRLANDAKDPNNWQEDIDWTFDAPASRGRKCLLAIYIPASPFAAGLAHYWVSSGSTDYDHRTAAWTIRQSDHRGSWVQEGPFAFSAAKINVELDDNGPGADVTVAAGPVHVSC